MGMSHVRGRGPSVRAIFCFPGQNNKTLNGKLSRETNWHSNWRCQHHSSSNSWATHVSPSLKFLKISTAFLKKILFLLERQRKEEQTEVFHLMVHSQIVAMASIGPAWGHERGASSKSPPWVTGAQHLGDSPLPFSGHQQGAGLEVGQAQLNSR